jgi:hypothetical protein
VAERHGRRWPKWLSEQACRFDRERAGGVCFSKQYGRSGELRIRRRKQRDAAQRKNGNEDDAASHSSTLNGFDFGVEVGANEAGKAYHGSGRIRGKSMVKNPT